MKVTNKGDQSRAKEQLEWIMRLTHTADGGQRSQGQPDFHHRVYWIWAEMSKGIKLAGGNNEINTAVETLCTFFSPVYRNAQKKRSCQHHHYFHPSMYASMLISYISHMVAFIWFNILLKVLHCGAGGVSFATILPPLLTLVPSPPLWRRGEGFSLVRLKWKSPAAFRGARLHSISSPVYFAGPSYLWVNVHVKCSLSALGCFLVFAWPQQVRLSVLCQETVKWLV